MNPTPREVEQWNHWRMTRGVAIWRNDINRFIEALRAGKIPGWTSDYVAAPFTSATPRPGGPAAPFTSATPRPGGPAAPFTSATPQFNVPQWPANNPLPEGPYIPPANFQNQNQVVPPAASGGTDMRNWFTGRRRMGRGYGYGG